MSGIDINELIKSQKVRKFDIYALGPFLIWAALQKKPLGTWTKRTLFAAGIMTVVYNWSKYKTMRQDLEEEVQNVRSLT